MVQEYGRYFGMPTCCLRGGCLTGPEPLRRRAARLPELPREVQPRRPRVPGLRLQGQAGARQHPRLDVARFMLAFVAAPRAPARSTISAAARRTPAPSSRPSSWSRSCHGQAAESTPTSTQNRIGDHICYYSDLRKMRGALSRRGTSRSSLEETIRQIVEAWRRAATSS